MAVVTEEYSTKWVSGWPKVASCRFHAPTSLVRRPAYKLAASRFNSSLEEKGEEEGRKKERGGREGEKEEKREEGGRRKEEGRGRGERRGEKRREERKGWGEGRDGSAGRRNGRYLYDTECNRDQHNAHE